MQKVPPIEKGKEENKRKESSACGNPTKGIAKRETSIFHQEKSTGNKKEVEENGRGRSSTCGQTTRSIVKKVEEKSGIYLMTKGIGTLQRRYS